MTVTDAERGPWRVALGDRFEELHPGLRAYFSRIPDGFVGRGSGTFEVVGTPRRWLWPALWALGRAGIVFPVWEREVAFGVENVPNGDSVDARRSFRLRRGIRVMRDSISARNGSITDSIGRGLVVRVRFAATVRDGDLHLRSTRSGIRLGRLHVTLPPGLAPVVALTERFDDALGCQHVSLVMTMPIVGRIYEYSGAFTYRIEQA